MLWPLLVQIVIQWQRNEQEAAIKRDKTLLVTKSNTEIIAFDTYFPLLTITAISSLMYWKAFIPPCVEFTAVVTTNYIIIHHRHREGLVFKLVFEEVSNFIFWNIIAGKGWLLDHSPTELNEFFNHTHLINIHLIAYYRIICSACSVGNKL